METLSKDVDKLTDEERIRVAMEALLREGGPPEIEVDLGDEGKVTIRRASTQVAA